MTTMTIPSMRDAHARVVVEPVAAPAGSPPRRRASGGMGRPRPVECDDSAGPALVGSRLTRRGWVVVAVLWAVLAVAAALALVRPGGAEEQSPPATVTVRVMPGDTLWQVVADVAPAGDPRETIADVIALNGLSSGADIAPGDVLRIPVQR